MMNHKMNEQSDMQSTIQKPVEGIIAEFDNPSQLLHAAEKLRDQGFTNFDCHSPFPIHGMDQAMGLKRSPLGWIVGIMGLSGAAGGMLLQWWTSAVDYKLVISGKPLFSFQAFMPVSFGIGVLVGALTAFLGMLILNRLPQPFHPVFWSDRFEKFSTDGFFVSIEALDPKFDIDHTKAFLQNIGGKNVEELKES
jgi:hypothetical protein